ncbi:HotDog domain-containing protein [Aspergillus ambiguus]|uniref:HotDog domain-containing protein n=1 Tax=Aspergillus ambiguus TaxID=176160 RepID=UPI003CCDA7E1
MSDYPTFNSQTKRWENVDFRKAAGHKQPVIKTSYNRKDVLLFANAIGATRDELHFLYELHPNFSTFPTFPCNLAFKKNHQDVIDFIKESAASPIPGVPPFDPQRTVDGERGIEILNPIPTSSEGLDLEVRPEIVGVYDKGGNMIMESRQTLVDARTGKVYAKLTGMGFGMKQGGYGGPRGPVEPPHPKPLREKPDAVHKFQLTPEVALLYRLCGDYNPMHADDRFGQRAGFKGHILQGLGTWNIAAHGVLKELGNSKPENFVRYKARFKAVVYPGDLLETRMWKTGKKEGDVEEIVFETLATTPGEKPRVVLSKGLAGIRTGKGASHL